MPFDPVDPKQSLPSLEEGILQYWREEDTFKRSLKKSAEGGKNVWDTPTLDANNTFSFYDGPPFATGLPHYGHLLAGTIKDVIPRYWTMRGKAVQRRFGWDCHGLPVENLVEKENNIDGKKDIEEKGVRWFNDLCRDSVLRYTSEWRKTVERMGRWVDMDWDYRTMDPDYMESMWWAFSELHKKEYIYEGYRPMHICPRCVTPLSNFEVTLGYSERTDMSTIATFPLVDDPKTIILAWTTTTWSLPGNLWIGLGADIEYVKVKQNDDDNHYIVSKKLVDVVFKDRDYEVVESVDPRDLVGKRYQPLFDFIVDKPMPSTEASGKPETFGERAFYIILHPEVAEEEGTGIVHFANTNAEDGFLIAKEEGIDLLHYAGPDGCFYPEIRDFAGLPIKPTEGDPMQTDKTIIAKLKEMGRWFDSFTFTHSYPHCWRCNSPLINYVGSSWFVNIEKNKDAMLNANAQTEWVPSHVRDGRFGNWLENARDWAISRNRYWGTPLPIWRSEESPKSKIQNPATLEVIGSRDDLMNHCKIRFTKVTALRHAESEGNLIPIYQSKEPGTNLTKKGRKDAKEVGKYYAKTRGTPIDIIYCSPLARAQETATLIAKETGAEIVTDDRLREVDFGEYEGKTIDFSDLTFIKDRRAHKIESGKPESIYHFDGMETWDSVGDRVLEFLEDVLPRHRSEHVMIVTHADLMVNIKHFFTKEDPVKLSHQPYPEKAVPATYFWDHDREAQLDLHKDTVDSVTWAGPPSDQSVEITLVRHGETDWNATRKCQGQEPGVHLNDKGREQAKTLAASLNADDYDAIVSSDLERAAETAEILSRELGIPLAGTWHCLTERDRGEWNGRNIDTILEENPVGIEGVTTSSFHWKTPKDGESISVMTQRAEEFCEKLLAELPGKRVLVVSHGGTQRALKAVIENLGYREVVVQEMKNAETVRLTVHPRLKRIPEVLDCWFESGSMPYAQDHYPFELAHAKMDCPPSFPADFIAEGMDQTRGWFYTLNVLGAALFGKSPFEHCVVNGIVLAEDGKKMSKSLKNYPDPLEVVDRHGADAIRFTLMSSPAVRGEDLRFSEKLVEENVRSVLLPLWNTYSFFVTYANAAAFQPVENRKHSRHPLDSWIRAEVQDLANRMTEELDNYDLSATCNELFETIDALTNWYVRLSRRRFAGRDGDDLQLDALHTLYDVLLTLSQLLAPFCPFITEAIYLNLVPEDHGSIHLTDWPQSRNLSEEEQALLQKTRLMRQIVSLGNSVRGAHNVKVRQPLALATIAVPPALAGALNLSENDAALLRSELNVKELAFAEDPKELAEVFVQVDARKVGPRLGGRVQEVIAAGKAGDFTEIEDGSILILEENLSSEEAQITYRGKEGEHVAADRGVVVSLDTTLTPELESEGLARDIIRSVQRLRKEEGYEFTDTIALHIEGADDVLASHKALIEEETRSTLKENGGNKHSVELDNTKLSIRFEKT